MKANILLLIKKAENGSDEEAKEAMKILRKIDPTYHWCTEWDDMVICQSDVQSIICLCEGFKHNDK